MNNQIIDEFDKASLIKEIHERDIIICNRDDAIRKIQELRKGDKDIATATVVNLSVSSTPFSQSTNDQIVRELAMQRNILQAKLIKKNTEEQR